MSTYVIGDIQGCYAELCDLLAHMAFDAGQDRVWLVGDLVNRGPDSAAVLRWAKGLGERCVAVLGNHDFHLLALSERLVRQHRLDTLDGVLAAPDRDELLDWLRHRPLCHRDGDWAMVHAGLWPEWSIEQALACSREVEQQLQGPDYREFLRHLYGNHPDCWHENLAGIERWRFIVNSMTRMRMITGDGRLDHDFKGELPDAPAGFRAWFDVPARNPRPVRLLCGHWSALGFTQRPELITLDTGCLWGRCLTAYRLDDGAIFQVPSRHPVTEE